MHKPDWLEITSVLALGAWLAASRASAQDFPNFHSLVFITGTCERLITPDQNRSATCRTTVVNINYRDGRSSFAFSDGDRAMVSFSGMDTAVTGDQGTLTLDHISLATNPGPRIDSEDATGSCEFSNAYAGRSYVRCTGRTASGEFSAAFTSDGNPPTRQEF